MTKKLKQKFEYLEKKAFFIIFKGLSVAKNYLRHESKPLSTLILSFIMLKMAKHTLKNVVNTPRILKYVWPFFNIMQEMVNLLFLSLSLKLSLAAG